MKRKKRSLLSKSTKNNGNFSLISNAKIISFTVGVGKAKALKKSKESGLKNINKLRRLEAFFEKAEYCANYAKRLNSENTKFWRLK